MRVTKLRSPRQWLQPPRGKSSAIPTIAALEHCRNLLLVRHLGVSKRTGMKAVGGGLAGSGGKDHNGASGLGLGLGLTAQWSLPGRPHTCNSSTGKRLVRSTARTVRVASCKRRMPRWGARPVQSTCIPPPCERTYHHQFYTEGYHILRE